jgi:hypothetical protein
MSRIDHIQFSKSNTENVLWKTSDTGCLSAVKEVGDGGISEGTNGH